VRKERLYRVWPAEKGKARASANSTLDCRFHKTGVTSRPWPHNIRVMQYWLVKQEAETYSWGMFSKDHRTAWTGVRNFQARNHLRAMKRGDLVLFYHSGSQKQIVGLARVEKESYPDPTAADGDWSCVDLIALKALSEPVGLPAIKADEHLKGLALVRQSRLSVMPVSSPQFSRIMDMAKMRLK